MHESRQRYAETVRRLFSSLTAQTNCDGEGDEKERGTAEQDEEGQTVIDAVPEPLANFRARWRWKVLVASVESERLDRRHGFVPKRRYPLEEPAYFLLRIDCHRLTIFSLVLRP